MPRKYKGFTIVELLVVLAIIAAMAAILFPVFSHIRKNGRRSASASNLHQCWTALQMYCDEYDASPRSMPTWDVAKQVLKNAPTCDLSDTWRTSCAEQFSSPRIGSYGYARAEEVINPDGAFDKILAADHMTAWEEYIRDNDPPLMTSIYYADVVPALFQGSVSVGTPPAAIGMPNRLLSVYMDGSVRTFQRSYGTSNSTTIRMGWNLVFTSQDADGRSNPIPLP